MRSLNDDWNISMNDAIIAGIDTLNTSGTLCWRTLQPTSFRTSAEYSQTDIVRVFYHLETVLLR